MTTQLTPKENPEQPESGHTHTPHYRSTNDRLAPITVSVAGLSWEEKGVTTRASVTMWTDGANRMTAAVTLSVGDALRLSQAIGRVLLDLADPEGEGLLIHSGESIGLSLQQSIELYYLWGDIPRLDSPAQ